MDAVRKYLPWVLSVVLAVFFIIFGLNKFAGFMGDPAVIFRPAGSLFGLPDFFANVVVYIVGLAEIVAGIMLLTPRAQKWGALLGLLVVLGALFFHIFSPLGIRVPQPDGTNDGGSLFIMAAIVFVLCGVVYTIRRKAQPGSAAA